MVSEAVEQDHDVRSIFVSDLHLGSRFAQAELLLEFLQRHQPAYLYLVGDIVDGWCLRRRWRWPETYNRLLDRLIELANQGTTIRLTPGNHDEFLRRFLMNNQLVSIHNEFIHELADGRRFAVLHGDLYDTIEQEAKWLSMVGGFGYETILRANHWTNHCLKRFGCQPRRFSLWVKERVKRAVQFVSDFEARVTEHAREIDCDGVICGHIHVPCLRAHERRADESLTRDTMYINLGDWVENSTALVEYGSGRLELMDVGKGLVLEESCPRPISDDSGSQHEGAEQDSSPTTDLKTCSATGDCRSAGESYGMVAPSYTLDR